LSCARSGFPAPSPKTPVFWRPSERKSPPLVGGAGEGEASLTARPLTKIAKDLRQDSTRAEIILWSRLKAKQLAGIKFRRQQPIGRFIVDFVSFEKRVIIELDGGQHAESQERDCKRDFIVAEDGFTVLRFWNNEVLENLEGVLDAIVTACATPLSPSPSPSHQGRGGRS